MVLSDWVDLFLIIIYKFDIVNQKINIYYICIDNIYIIRELIKDYIKTPPGWHKECFAKGAIPKDLC